MVNHNSTYRTNYFTVTDEAKYKELFSRLSGYNEAYYDLGGDTNV